jgi:hypothetical protein
LWGRRSNRCRRHLLRVYKRTPLLVSNSYALTCMFRSMPMFVPECPMRPFSFFASVLISHLRQLMAVLGTTWDVRNWDVRKYRPERHYMRGPGPKWREKHSSHPA